MKEVFEKIYRENLWKSDESVSGTGSTLAETVKIREFLPQLMGALGTQSLLDIPCGDFHWMRHLATHLNDYIGADIVPALIAHNHKYADSGIRFKVLDITKDRLPKVDLVLVRDLLGHFSNRDVKRALINLKRSGSTYLLSTTFPGENNDHDIVTGEWRPINLESMFGLPMPLMLYPEITVDFGDHTSVKSLGLWKLQDRG